MVEKLTRLGMIQSELDPCLFIGNTVIVVMYVDGILMWSTPEDHIYQLCEILCAHGIKLKEEDYSVGFLAVKLTKKYDSGHMILTQEVLIDCIIKALGLDVDQSTPRGALCLNRIQGKSMLKNKSPQIARDYMSSYIGYLRYEHIIAHVLVERVSSLKNKQQKQLTTM